MQPLDDLGIRPFGRAQQQAVDAMLAHPLDEAVLAQRRFRGIGEKGDPAGAIQRLVDPRRQLGVEGIGDLADDEPDRLGHGAPGDWPRRGHRHSPARRWRSGPARGWVGRPADCCAGRETPWPAIPRRAWRCPSPWRASAWRFRRSQLRRSGRAAWARPLDLDRSKLETLHGSSRLRRSGAWLVPTPPLAEYARRSAPSGGGCWKSRVRPLLDGDDKDRPENLCIDVVGDLPRCLDLIDADEVIRRIDLYLRGGVARELAGGEASLIRPLVDA